MYAVSKEHKGNKFFTKTRRAGIPQKFDNIDNNRDNNNGVRRDVNGFHTNDCLGSSSNPRPVFHQNGRKTYHQRNPTESISAQHQEIIKYIHESWNCVKKDLDSNNRHSISGEFKNPNIKDIKVPQISYYKLEKTSHLPKFEPFDLEHFWGQRLFHNITQSN